MQPSYPGLDPGSHLDYVELSSLQPHPNNPRAHSKKQFRQIAESIRAFGFKIPVVIDSSSLLICGHARVEAAKLAGIDRVPCLRVTDLSEEQIRALMIADNRLTDLSTWDDQLLGENLKILSDLDLDFEIEANKHQRFRTSRSGQRDVWVVVGPGEVESTGNSSERHSANRCLCPTRADKPGIPSLQSPLRTEHE